MCIDKKLFAPNPLQTYKVPDKAFPYYLEIFSASHTIWQYYLAILSSHIIFLILSGNIIFPYYLSHIIWPILSCPYYMEILSGIIIFIILSSHIIFIIVSFPYYLAILSSHIIWLYHLPTLSFPYNLTHIIFPI